MDVGDELGELASDIQLQAEQIRKERLSKRKAAQEAEKGHIKAGKDVNRLARTTSLVRALSNADEKPVVGNLIGEGHVNYVMMFNMLTGIRVAVSRCQAKIRRTLTDDDFSAAHKYSFDLYVQLSQLAIVVTDSNLASVTNLRRRRSTTSSSKIMHHGCFVN